MGMDLQEYYISTEWDLMQAWAVRHEKYYPCCEEPYTDIFFHLVLRRKSLFYTVNVIIPCVGISFLSVLVFYLPSDSGEKVQCPFQKRGQSLNTSSTVFYPSRSLCLFPFYFHWPCSSYSWPKSFHLHPNLFHCWVSWNHVEKTKRANEQTDGQGIPLCHRFQSWFRFFFFAGKYLLFTMILVTFSVVVTIGVLNVNFRTPATHKVSVRISRDHFCHRSPEKQLQARNQHQPFPNSNTLLNLGIEMLC